MTHDRSLSDGLAGLLRFARQLLRLNFFQQWHQGQAWHVQYRLNLSGGAENAIHDVPEKTHTDAERQSAEQPKRKNYAGLRLLLLCGGDAGEIMRASVMGNDSCCTAPI